MINYDKAKLFNYIDEKPSEEYKGTTFAEFGYIPFIEIQSTSDEKIDWNMFYKHFEIVAYPEKKKDFLIPVVKSTEYTEILNSWVSENHFIPDVEKLEDIKAEEDKHDLKLNTVIRRRDNSTDDGEAENILSTIQVKTGCWERQTSIPNIKKGLTPFVVRRKTD